MVIYEVMRIPDLVRLPLPYIIWVGNLRGFPRAAVIGIVELARLPLSTANIFA